MKKLFKKSFFSVTLAALAVVIGCKTIPSIDQVFSTAYAVGVASGLIANNTKLDDESRNAVVDIMGKVEMCVPETNQTFKAAWTPIAEAHTQQLFDEGKIDKDQQALIMAAFNAAVMGIDYLTSVRYPQVRQYTDLTEAGVHGFCTGFLTQFKPANATATGTKCTYDQEAYEYLLKATAAK